MGNMSSVEIFDRKTKTFVELPEYRELKPIVFSRFQNQSGKWVASICSPSEYAKVILLEKLYFNAGTYRDLIMAVSLSGVIALYKGAWNDGIVK